MSIFQGLMVWLLGFAIIAGLSSGVLQLPISLMPQAMQDDELYALGACISRDDCRMTPARYQRFFALQEEEMARTEEKK